MSLFASIVAALWSGCALLGLALLSLVAFCSAFAAVSARLAGTTQLTGKLVVVTGAGRGIGLDMCRELLQRRARVILLDVDATALASAEKALREEVPDIDGLCHGLQCDVTDAAAVAAVAREVLAVHGVPHVVINNAGVVSGRPFLELEPAHVHRTFAVNVFAHYYVLQSFLPHMMRKDSGTVVTIASTMAFFGAANLSDYCGSKFAAYGVHESMRLGTWSRISPFLSTSFVPLHSSPPPFIYSGIY
eukprot:TRINITY_DN7673_c0_g1_i4.p1 TRINITY_DN7673_c0_g1~~TRINITY_DN7673_c0_g1_i4.p1  ORF type:complete len:276 (-),score=75.22 TRINITY_DN7673_c0_g1_i4:457-1197(-)